MTDADGFLEPFENLRYIKLMQPFVLHAPQKAISAVVFDSPHSGIVLPDHFRYACTRQDLMHLHDPHVEKLLADVPTTGAPVLEALIHRTCIDLNRYDNEIDTRMIEGGWPHPVQETFYTKRQLGLFPVFAGPRQNRIAPIYNEHARLSADEAEYRINAYHRPYYAALHDLVAQALKRHGHAIHIDVHSFNRSPEYQNGDEIILGDLNGKLCTPALRDLAAAFFVAHGFRVGFNGDYFSGGAIVQATAKPEVGVQSLQIEIGRDLYMDQDTLAYLPSSAARVRDALTGLAAHIAKHIRPTGPHRPV